MRKRFDQALLNLSEPQRTRAAAEMRGDVYLFAQAVALQARRIRSGSTVGVEYQADQRLFAFALRSVLRAVAMLERLAEKEDAAALAAALEDFEAAVPDTKDLRDVLEHFDEYSIGAGNLQSGPRATERFPHFFERDPDRHVIHVGPLVVEVALAEAAVVHLATVALTLDPRPQGGDQE